MKLVKLVKKKRKKKGNSESTPEPVCRNLKLIKKKIDREN